MIAFFDTSIHVDLLRGVLDVDQVLARVAGGPVRLSPVVAQELLSGARPAARRAVDKLVLRLSPLEPPSWRQCWMDAGRLLPDLFRQHEAIGLGRLQNDALLALTARHTGAVFVTRDAHFADFRRRVPFAMVRL